MAQYPQWLTGDVITSARMSDSLPRYAYKLTNLDRFNTLAKTPDPDLQWDVEPNAVYTVDIHAFVGGTVAPGRIQCAWQTESGLWGGASWRGLFGPGTSATSDNNVNMRTTANSDINTEYFYGYRSSGADILEHVQEHGIFQTGPYPDVFSFAWGPESSVSTLVRVGRGSWGRLTRLA